MLYGALEAGGTKMVVAIADETGKIYDRASYPTETPEKTMPVLIDYFKKFDIKALGVGTFGPADLNEDSETYGYITSTPKPGWKNYNILGAFKDALKIPVGFDTDVNVAALGEATFGCMKGTTDGIYITIGTGVGVGVLSNGKLLHGMLHPEAGHILLARKEGDNVKSFCPFHDNCFEGLAAGPAIEKRWGKKAFDLKDNSEVWELEADYIAQALMNYILILSPKKIVLGGGVMHQLQLFPLIRKKTLELINGYVNTKELKDIDNYIVPASLNDNQGILGCITLAVTALK